MTSNWLQVASSGRILYLIRGSGMGKIALAKKISEEGVVLNPNDFFEFSGSYRWKGSIIEAANKWNVARARDYMEQGITPVAIDTTHKSLEVEPYIKLAEQFGYNVKVQEPQSNLAGERSKMPRDLKMNVSDSLTDEEKEVLNIVRSVAEEFAPGTTPRVAGGWVRDKLLGVPSDDIDIMLDNMSGDEFASLVAQKLSGVSKFTIKRNPEKSKHVETAEVHIPLSSGGDWVVQFAMARDEVYENKDSRVPSKVIPATPEEDAFRRDLTINSMFYNIITGEVEDPTGKGLDDLSANPMTIRTPTDPNKTFSDDPLRMFRVVRFAAKFGGEIAPEVMEAISNPSLIEDLRRKVSRERIGIEVEKMMKGMGAVKAMRLLKETGLMKYVVDEALRESEYDGKMAPLDMNQNNAWHKLDVWEHTMQAAEHLLDMYSGAEAEKRAAMMLGILFHDIGKLVEWIRKDKEDGTSSYYEHEKESRTISELIMKFMHLDPLVDQVSKLTRYHMQPHQLSDKGSSTLRKFIRRMTEESVEWIDVFNLAMADAMSKSHDIDPSIVEEYKNLEMRLSNLKAEMDSAAPYKEPILNGNEIMQALGVKGGPWMKEMVEFIASLRDENPFITKDEALTALKGKFGKPEATATATTWIKEAMALDPDAWENEPNPARLQQHQDQVPTGYKNMTIRQPQDRNNLRGLYRGVHLTGDKMAAIIYANLKSHENDPPVVIEVDPTGLERFPDVDAAVEDSIGTYVADKTVEWKEILSNREMANLDIADELLDNVRSDNEMWDSQTSESNASSAVIEKIRVIPPVAIEEHIHNMDDDQIIKFFSELVSGEVPPELEIACVQQFRVMESISEERVRGIYIAPWIDLDAEIDRVPEDPEGLAEMDYTERNGKIYNSNGQIVLNRDDIEYEWLSNMLEPIYTRQDQALPGMDQYFGGDSVWHGTTLIRATKALPKIFNR